MCYVAGIVGALADDRRSPSMPRCVCEFADLSLFVQFFETFSFLPALTDEDISKQVTYIVGNGWTPCLEFAEPENAYTASQNSVRMGNVASGYQDNRYWTMWKLPMFGCTDGSQVLAEMKQCTKAFPGAYIRLVAFDAVRQVQMCGFLVHRPPQCSEYKKPENRSVA